MMKSTSSIPFVVRFWSFLSERFPLTSHMPMIAVFTLANITVGGMWFQKTLTPLEYIVPFLLALSFFLRLRLFDELKDYGYDLKVNPERPLARGLIALHEVKLVLRALVCIEIMILALSTSKAWVSYVFALCYSLLMYKEFFIGAWLRPHLTTYAVTHTVVASLIGFLLVSLTYHHDLHELSLPIILFGIANWALFNLFEFVRKTFAVSEERARVETYSSTFGSVGASLLTFSQMCLFMGTLSLLSPRLIPLHVITMQLGIALVLLLVMGGYLVFRSPRSAALYRTAGNLYLLLAYLCFLIRT